LAAKDPRPGPRNLDAARLIIGHYRTTPRIRAFEKAALGGLEKKRRLPEGEYP
jgi:hypothetical protein